ncbi:MAG: IS30 family transposase [Coriobacteriales bacterium]|nr:IS30 family transposase [Coriobacteriales bacterium]
MPKIYGLAEEYLDGLDEEGVRKRKGKYFNDKERNALDLFLNRLHLPVARIAKILGRCRKTIYREIERGSILEVRRVRRSDGEALEEVPYYHEDVAQRRAEARWARKGPKLKLERPQHRKAMLWYAQEIIENRRSPDEACGRARMEGKLPETVCTKTIYNYANNGKLGYSADKLPMAEMRRKAKHKKYTYKQVYTRGESIDERPAEVEAREEFGHWEGDLVVGKRGGRKEVVLTLLERKTRIYLTAYLESKDHENVVAWFDDLELTIGSKLFQAIFKSITWDNGTEFTRPDDFETSVYELLGFIHMCRTRCYYAHAYHSWERGSNENCNGLLRQAGIRKGHNIAEYGAEGVARATEKVNNKWRKSLGYRSAKEKFLEELKHILY